MAKLTFYYPPGTTLITMPTGAVSFDAYGWGAGGFGGKRGGGGGGLGWALGVTTSAGTVYNCGVASFVSEGGQTFLRNATNTGDILRANSGQWGPEALVGGQGGTATGLSGANSGGNSGSVGPGGGGSGGGAAATLTGPGGSSTSPTSSSGTNGGSLPGGPAGGIGSNSGDGGSGALMAMFVRSSDGRTGGPGSGGGGAKLGFTGGHGGGDLSVTNRGWGAGGGGFGENTGSAGSGFGSHGQIVIVVTTVDVAEPVLHANEGRETLTTVIGPVAAAGFTAAEGSDGLVASATAVHYRPALMAAVEDSDDLSAAAIPAAVASFSGSEGAEDLGAFAVTNLAASFDGSEQQDYLAAITGDRFGQRPAPLAAVGLIGLTLNCQGDQETTELWNDSESWDDDQSWSTSGFVRQRPSIPRAVLPTVVMRGGTITGSSPALAPEILVPGGRQRSFRSDWYYRIHLLPNMLDIGAIPNAATRTATLWNAWPNPVVLTETQSLGESGVTISGLNNGLDIRALGTLGFTVNVGSDGPYNINGRFQFNFGSSLLPSYLTVTGKRAVLFDFAPNWSKSVDVDLEFRTDIITTRSGREQRRALRRSGRKRFEFSVTVDRERFRSFTRLLKTAQNRDMTLGDPTRSVTIASTTAPGAESLTLNSAPPAWMTIGATIVIDAADRMEAATIKGINGSQISLVSGSTQSWPKGARVRPGLTGRLDDSISAKNLTDNVAAVTIGFRVEPGSEPYDGGDPGLLVHNGREVFPFNPNWARGVDNNFDWPVEEVDYGYGVVNTYRPVAFGSETRRATFVGIGRDETDGVRRFFERMRGRQGEFYLPSGQEDLLMAAPAIAGNNTLRIRGTDVADNFLNDPVHRSISLTLFGGAQILRTVTGMTGDDGESVLQLSQTWQSDISPSEVKRISWMTVTRMASDLLTTEWLTDSVTQIQMSMKTLPDDEPDLDQSIYDGAALWVLESGGIEVVNLYDPLDQIVNVIYPEIVG